MKNIRIQWFVLFIMVLLLMGCGMQKNVDFKNDQGMKIANALPIREDTGSDRSNLDILDEILVQCLTDYDINKGENEDWIIYECKPIEDTLYADCPVIEVKKNFTSEILTYEEAKPFFRDIIDYDQMWHYVENNNEYGIGQIFEAAQGNEAYYLLFLENDSFLVHVEGKLRLESELTSQPWDQEVRNQYGREMVECADGAIAQIISDISFVNREARYEFCLGEEETYQAVLEIEDGEPMQYHFTLYRGNKEMQDISWTSRFESYPEFLDANRDGYVDMMVATDQVPAYEIHDLYIWNNQSACFEQVAYDDVLAWIEIEEDGIRNWIRNGDGYILQTLQWRGKELIRVKEEEITPISETAQSGAKSFDSTRDFPYENMQVVSDEVYEVLKDAYGKMDFSVEFKGGNIEDNSEYIYAGLKRTEQEMKKIDEHFDPHEYIYYVFDMDGDSLPEICVWKYMTYIFKYDAEEDKVHLWREIKSPWEQVFGTNKLGWNWEGVRCSMCRLDQNGDTVSGVCFMEEAAWSNGKETFLVTMPFDLSDDQKFVWTGKMKSEAYYSREDDLFFFPVTKEQYQELTKRFYEAETLADQERKKVGYTYDELSGKKMCEQCTKMKALYL